MGILKEFKEFAATGNLVDLAAGVIMGAAVGKVVSSFIDGMIMPLVGMVTGGQDFGKLKYVLKPGVDAVTEVKDAAGAISRAAVPAVEEVAIKYGAFISQIIDFLLVAFVVFMVLKAVNKMKKKQAEAAPAGPSSTDALLMEIRDSLKK
jgi:large conductance mechanosensitive channel